MCLVERACEMKLSTETVLLAKGGDREAFGRLYESVALDLYKMALYTLGNREDAEDIVSETFIEAYKGIAGLRDIESFKPWITRILSIRCKRRIGGYIRTRGQITLDDYIEEGQPGNEGIRAELLDAMGKLTAQERELIVLAAIHGYTMREIADIKQMPQGTVSSKLHRTYAKLRNMLKE